MVQKKRVWILALIEGQKPKSLGALCRSVGCYYESYICAMTSFSSKNWLKSLVCLESQVMGSLQASICQMLDISPFTSDFPNINIRRLKKQSYHLFSFLHGYLEDLSDFWPCYNSKKSLYLPAFPLKSCFYSYTEVIVTHNYQGSNGCICRHVCAFEFTTILHTITFLVAFGNEFSGVQIIINNIALQRKKKVCLKQTNKKSKLSYQQPERESWAFCYMHHLCSLLWCPNWFVPYFAHVTCNHVKVIL